MERNMSESEVIEGVEIQLISISDSEIRGICLQPFDDVGKFFRIRNNGKSTLKTGDRIHVYWNDEKNMYSMKKL